MTVEPNLVLVMRSRVRRHFLTVFGGFFVGLAGCMALGGTAPPAIARFVAPLFILIVGSYSTVKNLRCPACEKMVAWQVSQNFSAYAPWAKHECRHCGVKIFPGQGEGTRKGFKVMAILIIGGIVVAAIAGLASILLVRPH